MRFETRVVDLGSADHRFVERGAVERYPPEFGLGTVAARAGHAHANLVRHRNVRVKVGIAGSGVAMSERGRDEAF